MTSYWVHAPVPVAEAMWLAGSSRGSGGVVGTGDSPVAVGGCAEPPGDGFGGVRGELVGLGGALAEVAGVLVGADGVAAAGTAVVLAWGRRVGAGFAERGVAPERRRFSTCTW